MTRQRDIWKTVGSAGSLGFTLVACTFVGLAIGYFLDNRLDTHPWFTIGCLVVGIVAGFFNMIHHGLTYKDDAK